MPKLIIDEQKILVPEGTKVMEAAERLGIIIPRFCYHEALGSVGACRMCAVKFVEGHRKSIDMSCMVEAKDGMVVSTSDPEAVAFRRYVIEWLMLNHPHDCPVCDEGGHCLLQDETVSGGHGIRRYSGKKRTYHDQDLGPFVQHEMNRCIHCFRCRRFYQDFAGYRDLGVMQIGHREYFGRFESGRLESPFSGNLIDICPTGVYTDKPARFKGRRWNFERGPSLCLHCSLGCCTTGSARYREMMRQEARYSEAVNGHFLCDRGRFGFDFANHKDRPRRALVGGKEVSWEDGIRSAAEGLMKIDRGAVLCAGSDRCSLETQFSIKRMCGLLGWHEPRFFMEPNVLKKVKTALKRLDERLVVSMRRLEDADFILVLGADPVNEAPMLALAMRQAWRKGATVAVVDPRPVFLPFSFSHLAVIPDEINLCAGALARQVLEQHREDVLSPKAVRFYERLPEVGTQRPDLQERLRKLGERLGRSKRPVVVCGTDIVRPETPGLAADIAELLHRVIEGAGLFYLLPGPNAFGAGLVSPHRDPESMLETLESGKVKALMLVEQDPFWACPDRERLEQALSKVDFLLILDYLPSAAAEKAHGVLPTVPHFECTPVSFVNQEGRLQMVRPVHNGGTPISLISGGKHPPRTFLNHIPGGDPKAAHEVLAELHAAISGDKEVDLLKDLRDRLSEEAPLFKDPSSSRDGIRLLQHSVREDDIFSWENEGVQPAREGLELLLTHWTFGTEELSAYSRPAREGETMPTLTMHPWDAGRLALVHGDRNSLRMGGGELALDLAVASNMAEGTILLPRHRQVEWRKLKTWPVFLPESCIRKTEGVP
ncbi:MAG: NADH-quinone oxidoreductase subunit NuoG [Deltaproteobacteria bacterium]|nr:NADH-quinone oxidoreductase subunit NuoG [Deltaproteobacteria bacterium]